VADVILALDQGTTSSRAILFGHDGLPLMMRSKEFTQHYPQPGWVEHDPEDIWDSQIEMAKYVLNSNQSLSKKYSMELYLHEKL